MNLRLRNPIPKQINDTKKVTDFLKKMGLVPYAGTNQKSSHKFLSYLCDLYELSPTHGACINDIRYYAFDGDLDIVKKTRAGLKVEREEIDISVKEKFCDALEEVGLDLTKIVAITKKLFTALKITGNAYLYYKEVTVGGTKRVFMYPFHPKKIMYLDTEEGEEMAVVMANEFSEKYFKQNPDKVKTYPVFPAFDGSETKGIETVFHLKIDGEESNIYGRPDSISSLFWQHIEFALGELSVKVGSTEIVAQKILAFQNPDPNYKLDPELIKELSAKRSATLRKLLTNEGVNPQSIGTIDYPFGNQAPTVIDVEVNRDTGYLKETLNIASSYICAAHRWSGIITGKTAPSSGIGGNTTIDQFKIRDEGVVRGHQRFFSNFWTKPFSRMAEYLNTPILAENTTKFPNTIEDLTESLNKNRQNNQQQQRELNEDIT